ncbi:MAG: thermopsin family protease [Thermoplasmata archaeon]
MVLPASATLQSHSGLSSASGASAPAAGASYGASPAAPTNGATPVSAQNPFSSQSTSAAKPTIPSAAPAVSNALSNEIQKLEAGGARASTIAMVQGIAAGVQSGAIPADAAILPNLNFLLGKTAAPSLPVAPTYPQAPAPMGIADIGLGTTPYEYNTSAIEGTTTLASLNATAGSLYENTGQYYWSGNPASEAGNPYDWGIQLNTVVQNITVPGSTAFPLGSGVFWTQNVPDFTGNSVQFIDNVWNFSSSDADMTPGTIYSASGVLVPYYYYYDIGPSFPVVYPVVLHLYNNASIIDGRSAVSFGYRLVDGNGKVYTGVYDTVIFNSPNNEPLLNPQFQVNGFNYNPFELLFDAEMVFSGPGDGSNAVITAASAQMTLQYLPTGSTAWTSVPAAYDYGGNTGETATGVAAYWSGTTAYFNQGPSLLYGLWGTNTATVGVPSGSIQFTGTLSPIYAFAFIGENISGLPADQMWAPSNALGIVSTYLPPSIPGSASYTVAAYAAEYANYTGANFTTGQTSYAITMTSSHGSLYAPLYMNGEAQATALAKAIDGSATVPYTFKNLVVDVGQPFNLLNDLAFPLFNLFYATGVTSPLAVDNVVQGPNFDGYTLYNWYGTDYNLPHAGQEFVDYDGVNDTFTDLQLPGFFTNAEVVTGGAVSLWNTTNVVANDITSTNDSFGIWASAATNTKVMNSNATDGAAAFSVIASTGAVGWNDSSYDDATAIFDEGGTAGTFTYLNASYEADGFYGFWANATTLRQLQVGAIADGAYLVGGIGLTVTNITVNAEGYLDTAGVFGYGVNDTTVTTASFSDFTDPGIGLQGGANATISNLKADDSLAVSLEYGFTNGTVSNLVATNASLGVGVYEASDVKLSGISANGSTVGAEIEDSMSVTMSHTSASNLSLGSYIYETSQDTVNGVSATTNSVGVYVYGSDFISVSNVTASDTTPSALYSVQLFYFGLPLAAVVTEYTEATGISNVVATNYGAALFDVYSDGLQVSTVNATSDQYGMVFNATYNSYVNGLGAYKDWIGLLLQSGDEESGANDNYVTGSSFVDDTSFGVAIFVGDGNMVTGNNFVGDNGAISTYNAAHVQAWSEIDNNFNTCTSALCASGVGNYWADWHTYGSNGYLAPYIITGSTADLFPIGPQEMFTVTFVASGLSSGTTWSVTLGGVTITSNTTTVTFSEPMGTYTYYIGPLGGYDTTPTTGTLTVTGPTTYNVPVSFTSTTSYVSTNTFNTWFAVAIALAVIALVLGLLALFLHRRREQKTPPPPGAPQPWTPPPAAESTTGGSAPSAGAGTWSEGPPPGASPPS